MENLVVAIPQNAANLQLPDPTLLDYYRDEEQRIFWVDGEIDESLLDLVKMIMRCNKEDKDLPVEQRKPVRVFIDSPGGDVQALFTTIKAIEISKTPVYTINYCGAYSAAAILLTAGHKRFALPGTSAMFHRGSCYYGGEQSVVESTKKYFDTLDKKLDEFLFSHTNIDQKIYKRKVSSDLYMDENECLKNNVVDSIVSNFEEIM